MNTKHLVTGIVAGIIVFAWGFVSWMALPFHASSMNKLAVEPVAVQAIKQAAPESGMYAYPGMDASKEEMAKASHILVAMNYNPIKMPFCMLVGLGLQILAGLFLTCLVCKSNITDLKDRLLLILKVVIFAFVVGDLANWLYWGFSLKHTVLMLADLIISWGIAGFWIAKRV